MRNCFVPYCDALCKAMPKRKMFLPPKDPEIFEKWREILPKKRIFKTTDKVCERHFEESCIITTWDHMIQGELISVQRNKPMLKPNAIPSKNFPPEEEIKRPKRRNSGPNRPAKKVFNSPEMPIDHAVVILDENDIQISMSNSSENHTLELKTIEPPQEEENHKTSELFETFYDEVFEVILPSTLWGIHRDPDREYLAFTQFNQTEMNTTKIFHIDSKLHYKLVLNNNLYVEKSLSPEELNVEKITEILGEFDEV